MSMFALLLLAGPLAAAAAARGQAGASPLGEVISLIDGLAAKITAEGEVEAKAYVEYIEWCDDAAKNSQFAIETAQQSKAKLEANIGEFASNIEVASSKIGELAADIATTEGELKDAMLIREKEAADFAASEQELMDGIGTLGRATGILEKELAKNPAAFAQVDTTSTGSALKALSAILSAAAVSGSDQRALQALLQSQQEGAEGSDEDEAPLGAPAAATYKSHSSGILDVLEDLQEKAEGQLSELRKAELSAKHNYEMLRQSLEDQAAADTKSLGEAKVAKAEGEQAKATAEGDLERTSKDLANSNTGLEMTHTTCMTTAADHEATTAARAEELKVIAEAKKILLETTSGAASQSYSLLQLRAASSSALGMRTRADLARSEVITMVKSLAKQHHSPALAQLASRIAAIAKLGAASGEDPFAKIKGLIQDMVAKLEKEAGAEATEKAYCDEELAKTEAKQSELDEDVAKATARIDQAASKSAELKEEVQVLEGQLSALVKEQAEIDKIRQETHADYVTAKADLELGLSGIRRALGVLRDYYSAGAAAMLQDDANMSVLMQQPTPPEKHGKAAGAGSSIIGLLEVVESDFAKGLAAEEMEEAAAQSEYEKVSQENHITKTMEEQDVKYKVASSKSLDKTTGELTADREATGAELAAVLEYYARLKERCIAKPEAYGERQRRRAAEVEGLKAALATLESETALVQRKQRGSRMRGALAAR